MKKLGLILFILLTGIFMIESVSAQSKTPATGVAAVEQASDSSTTDNTEDTGDQIDKLIDKAINAKISDLENDENEITSFVGTVLFLVIVLPILITFLAIVLIVFFTTKHRKEREKARYDLYLKSIESGQPLPEKIFEEPIKKSSNLKKGAIWLAVGLGTFVLGYFQNNSTLMGASAIPAFIGIAFLIVCFIEKKNNNNDTSAVNE